MARSMLLLYMLRQQLMTRSEDEESTDEYASGEELTDQDSPGEELTDQGTSEKKIIDQGNSKRVLTDQGTSGKVWTDQGMSENELTEHSTSEEEVTDQVTSEDVNSKKTLNIERKRIKIKKEVCGEKKCRICLEEGCIPIYREDTENISEALMILCGIEVAKDDPFPKFICEACNTLLEAAILLRKTAQESDRKLKRPVEVMLVTGDDTVNYDDDDNSSDYELCKDTNSTHIGKQVSQTDFKLGNQSYITLEQPYNDIEQSYDPLEQPCNDRNQSYNTLEQPYNVRKLSYSIEEQPHIKLKKYYCMKCEISFNTFEDYTDHKSSQEHKNKRVNLIQTQSNNSNSTLHSETDLTVCNTDYLCDLCGKKCNFQSDLVSHRKTHFLNLTND